VLRWAKEHDCAWDGLTCDGAATHINLDVLQWALEHGCPGKRNCEYASHNHLEMHGCGRSLSRTNAAHHMCLAR
jgi:hypothetical protein